MSKAREAAVQVVKKTLLELANTGVKENTDYAVIKEAESAVEKMGEYSSTYKIEKSEFLEDLNKTYDVLMKYKRYEAATFLASKYGL